VPSEEVHLRSVAGLLFAVSIVAVTAACERRDESPGAVQPTTGYAGQPPYGATPGYPGYSPYPGTGDPYGGYPPPGGYPAPPPTGAYPPPQPTGTVPAPAPTTTPPPPPTTQPAPTTGQPGGLPFPIPGFPFPGGTAPSGGTTPGGGAPPAGGTPPGGQQGSASATPIDPTFATAATVPLMALANTEAPGMQREGPVVAGQFQEGQSLESTFQMLPGKCYTVLAVGAGISEMDIALIALTPLPGASPVLAQDTGQGASAVLGGRGNCYKWSLPVGINAKMVLKATRGQGVAAGQLYVK
jgi:hypothetical protein